jgi:hypothetical protein
MDCVQCFQCFGYAVVHLVCLNGGICFLQLLVSRCFNPACTLLARVWTRRLIILLPDMCVEQGLVYNISVLIWSNC